MEGRWGGGRAGTLGTLTELCLVWNVAALDKLLHKEPAQIFLYREPWEGVIAAVGSGLSLPAAHTAMLTYIDDEVNLMTHLQGREHVTY